VPPTSLQAAPTSLQASEEPESVLENLTERDNDEVGMKLNGQEGYVLKKTGRDENCGRREVLQAKRSFLSLNPARAGRLSGT
jgi:hypothetical protein